MSVERRTVLFVDDEQFMIQMYLEKLKRDYEVIHIGKADDAAVLIRSQQPLYGMVLDIMMPPLGARTQPVEDGPGQEQRHEGGLQILQELWEPIMARPLPVMVLTNMQSKHILPRLKALSFPKWWLRYVRKRDLPAAKICDEMQSYQAVFWAEWKAANAEDGGAQMAGI